MNKLLEIQNLTVRYGSNTALQNVSFSMHEGEFVALMGPNGGGKTTLLRTVLGLLTPTEGSVRMHTRRVGYVPQSSAVDRNFPISVKDVVKTATLSEGLHPHLFRKKTNMAIIDSCLERVGLLAFKERQISELSGGEFQRLLIARALATDPELLLLDEPTANIDPPNREHIYRVLRSLIPQKAILLITHDLAVLNGTADRLLCLGGTLLYDGKPTLTTGRLHNLYGYCPDEGGCTHD